MLNNLFHRSGRTLGNTKTDGLLKPWKKILLPAVEAPFSMRSVHAACRLTLESPNCELRLLYVIEVPRSVALQASMPADDGMAEDALGAALTAALAYGVTAHTEVLHVREAADGVAKYVTQQSVELLVLGSRADGLRGMPLQLCQDLYQKVACEVILNYIGAES
jgi:nucleotide-binding universal stress UspA family protein